MDKYNLQGLSDFLLKYEFHDYAVVGDCVLLQKKDDKKWHRIWGDPSSAEYNKNRTETTLWRKIMAWDSSLGKMSARQKVELMEMIIKKLEVA